MEKAEIKYRPSPDLKEELVAAKKKSAKALLWIAIISMVMFWAGLTSAYIVRHDAGNWLVFQLPSIFFASTAVIILSSITFLMAQNAVKKNNYKMVTLGVLSTLILGFVFVYLQYKGWSELTAKNVVFGGKYSNPSGSFFILFIWAHWAHLFGGIISLIVVLINSLRKRYTAQNALGIELCGLYWHFLDLLWVYLFLFLYFIR
jgi:cytochrome c oxidase subunit 3